MNSRIGIIIFVITLITLLSCTSEKPLLQQSTVDAFMNFQDTIQVPCNFPVEDLKYFSFSKDKDLDSKTDTVNLWNEFNRGEAPCSSTQRFDINSYFSILTHLKMDSGYTLDFVYKYNSSYSGHPILYARNIGDSPYSFFSDYFCEREFPIRLDTIPHLPDYFHHIRINDSPEGYFESIVLLMMGSQFWQFWHAYYDDDLIICDTSALNKIRHISAPFGPISDSLLLEAKKLSLAPIITLDDYNAIISIIGFSKWGGFYRITFKVSRRIPHELVDVDNSLLLKYDCGIVF